MPVSACSASALAEERGTWCFGGGSASRGIPPLPVGHSSLGPAGRLVQGKYTQFKVDPTDFAVYNQSFTGAANPLDQTIGRFTPIYASKVPNHPGPL
jgi:hypothetical protein